MMQLYPAPLIHRSSRSLYGAANNVFMIPKSAQNPASGLANNNAGGKPKPMGCVIALDRLEPLHAPDGRNVPGQKIIKFYYFAHHE